MESQKIAIETAQRIVAILLESGMSSVEAAVTISITRDLIALHNLPFQSEREYDAAQAGKV